MASGSAGASGLTALDMMVLLSLGVAGVFGAMRGFVSEVFSLAAWIVGFFAVKLLYVPVEALLEKPVGSGGGASMLAVALCFGIAFVATRLVGNQVRKATHAALLGPVDRVLGLGFGVLKGLLAATLAFLFMTLIFDFLNGENAARPAWMSNSKTYPLLRASSAALVGAVEAGRAP
jgi:membrane protein required for colicin V production